MGKLTRAISYSIRNAYAEKVAELAKKEAEEEISIKRMVCKHMGVGNGEKSSNPVCEATRELGRPGTEDS